VVVVVKADRRGRVRVSGLPPGRYGADYTTEHEYAAAAPDVAVDSAGRVTATIPAKGVLTIFGR
jgi:hypothetical protein